MDDSGDNATLRLIIIYITLSSFEEFANLKSVLAFSIAVGQLLDFEHSAVDLNYPPWLVGVLYIGSRRNQIKTACCTYQNNIHVARVQAVH